MFHFITGIILLYSASAMATCFSHCQEIEEGVVVETSCAAPGGPVHTTTDKHAHECKDNRRTEWFCSSSQGMGFAFHAVYPWNCVEEE